MAWHGPAWHGKARRGWARQGKARILNMIEIGQKYYIVAHVYYHFVGEVIAVTPRTVTLKNVCQVHACRRDWSAFFAEGFRADTSYDVWPDGTVVPIGLQYAPWPHAIPREPKR
jgi:hypothetical protein